MNTPPKGFEDLLTQAIVPDPPDPPQPARPFQSLGLGELLERPAKVYTVQQWFGPRDQLMFFGDSGTAKTFLAIDVMMRGALGIPIADQFEVARPFRSLYCAEEGIGGIPQRFKAAAEAHGLEPGTEAWGRIRTMEVVPKLFLEDSEQGLREFMAELSILADEGFTPDLIMFDTLADVILGSNENDNSHATMVNSRCHTIREVTGAAVVYIHHAPKTGEGYRGASAYKAKCDLMIEVIGTENPRQIRCFKAKDAEGFQTQRFHLSPHGASAVVEWDGPSSIRPSDKRTAEEDQRAEMIRVLREHAKIEGEAMTVRDIHDLMLIKPTDRTLTNWLGQAAKSETSAVQGVSRQMVAANGRPNRHAYHYWIDLSTESF
jgi:RecA-family ATPase